MGANRVTIQTTKNSLSTADAVFGEYLFDHSLSHIHARGVHGNSGDKSAGKDVFGSGKGRKCPEISGDRYSQILWEQRAAGSNPVASTIMIDS